MFESYIGKQFFYQSEEASEARFYLELPNHENIVKLIDYFFDENIEESKFYMVFEYCEVNTNLFLSIVNPGYLTGVKEARLVSKNIL